MILFQFSFLPSSMVQYNNVSVMVWNGEQFKQKCRAPLVRIKDCAFLEFHCHLICTKWNSLACTSKELVNVNQQLNLNKICSETVEYVMV
jgi:hypothetical protein